MAGCEEPLSSQRLFVKAAKVSDKHVQIRTAIHISFTGIYLMTSTALDALNTFSHVILTVKGNLSLPPFFRWTN